MTAPNHLLGGLLFTGVCGSFLQLNVLASPVYLLTTGLASLLPDVDTPRSPMGRLLRPLSRYLHRQYGHRTLTHALPALGLCYGVFCLIEWVVSAEADQPLSSFFLLGYLSHLVLDMMTVRGVPLLYPFWRNSCVLPGNPDLRFRSGQPRSEAIIFCFLSLGLVFLQPLMANGFWTQYNRYFGTPKHLASEMRKTDVALWVEYRVKKGTMQYAGEGYCLAASPAKVVLLHEQAFTILDQQECFIQQVIPTPTERQLRFETTHFLDFPVDSLNALVRRHQLQNIRVHGNQAFQLFYRPPHRPGPDRPNPGVGEKGQFFELHYPAQLFVQAIEKPVTRQPFTPYTSPRIHTLIKQIERLQAESLLAHEAFQQTQAQFRQLRQQYHSETDLITKERLLRQIKALQQIPAPVSQEARIVELQARITELQLADRIRNAEKAAALQLEYERQLPAPTLLSGSITTIHFE